METCYPLSFEDQRTYPGGFDGRVYIWDIDKTYLDTRFSSLKGMARIPIEFAVDKRAIPGMPEVLRGLRRGRGRQYAATPLYFVSASPPQIRKVIARKMLMDGVEYDGIAFKDWARSIFSLRPGRLREQVGFKLCALLSIRQNRPDSREYLFGDDVESDAEAFHLYSRLLAGELSAGDAENEMKAAGVKKDDRRCVHSLIDRLCNNHGSVEKVFIHLARETDPAAFSHLTPLVVPVKGGCQLALACYELGLIDEQSVDQAIRSSLAAPPHPDKDALFEDAVERKLVSKTNLKQLEKH